MLKNIRIVLVKPSHPGNIGAVARSMKNMGITSLALVEPKQFPHYEATERASGAADVLEHAMVVGSVQDAIQDCHFVLATSSRERSLHWPQVFANEAAMQSLAQAQSGQVAILFGAERTGLLNEELQLAHKHVIISANPIYPSLNLAQAVQIVCYEIYQQSQTQIEKVGSLPASKDEFEGVIEHFEQVLEALKIWDPKHPKKLMPKIRRMLTKANLEPEEVNLLRGLLKVFHTQAQENEQFKATN